MNKDNYFFCPFLQVGDNTLCSEESQHITRVMRYKLGDNLTLFNGKGLTAKATIASFLPQKKDQVVATVSKLTQAKKNNQSLRIYLSPPKGKLFPFLLRQLASLGIAEIIPVQYERSIRLGQFNHNLLQKNFIIACKQSHNPFFPKLCKTIIFADALAQAKGDLFFGSLNKKTQVGDKKASIISLFVGPEGDFSPKEENLLLEKAYPLQLDCYTLKIETACIALIAKFL